MPIPLLTPLPTAPSRSVPASFAATSDEFFAAQVDFQGEMNDDVIPGINDAISTVNDLVAAAGFTATSVSTVTIGTGSKSFAVQAGRAFLPGAFVMATDQANTANWMWGQVTAYDASDGNPLTINVLLTGGSGSISAWNITLSGPQGLQGLAASEPVLARGSNTILGLTDLGKVLRPTAAFTQTLDAAATLGAGWWVDVLPPPSGVLILDANSSETIDGHPTIRVYAGEAGFRLHCDGSAFYTRGRSRVFTVEAKDSTGGPANIDFTTGWDDTELKSFRFEWSAISFAGSAGLQLNIDTGSGYAAPTGGRRLINATGSAANNGEISAAGVGASNNTSGFGEFSIPGAFVGQAHSPADAELMSFGFLIPTGIVGVRFKAATSTFDAGIIRQIARR